MKLIRGLSRGSAPILNSRWRVFLLWIKSGCSKIRTPRPTSLLSMGGIFARAPTCYSYDYKGRAWRAGVPPSCGSSYRPHSRDIYRKTYKAAWRQHNMRRGDALRIVCSKSGRAMGEFWLYMYVSRTCRMRGHRIWRGVHPGVGGVRRGGGPMRIAAAPAWRRMRAGLETEEGGLEPNCALIWHDGTPPS